MPVIARESGAHDRLLRPLCARSLAPTLPQREAWVDVEKLPSFGGRSRKPQIALASQLGFEDYAQPAGGCCFLTNSAYSSKLQDLWRSRGERDYELDDIMLLKVGRHLRPRPGFKLIIGREDGENKFLRGYRKQFAHISTVSHFGPLTLVDGAADAADLTYAASIAARFSQGRDADTVRVEITTVAGESSMHEVTPIPADDVPAEWYV